MNIAQLFEAGKQKIGTFSSLRAQPLVDVRSGDTPSEKAVRWIDGVSINNRTSSGLFMHPPAQASVRMTVQPRTSLNTHIALLPEVWDSNNDGVIFSVTVADAHGKKTGKEFLLHPRANLRHRAWIPWSINLSHFAGQPVIVKFATRIPKNGSTAYAWSFWGNPCVYQRFTFSELIAKIQRHVHAEGLRGGLVQFFTKPHPSPSVDRYALWQQQHALTESDITRIRKECASFAYKPIISIITPVHNTDPRWLKACIESVRAQYYPLWQLCICDDGSDDPATRVMLQSYAGKDSRIQIISTEKNCGIAAASNKALALASGEFVGLLDHDDEISPDAIYEVVKFLQQHRDADMIYSDEDKKTMDGTRVEPFFKPDWSPEYFLSVMYTSHFGVYRKKIVEDIGGFRSAYDKAQDYDMVLRFIEKTAAQRIHHIPKILYHWRKIPGSTATSMGEKNFSDSPATRALQDYLNRKHIDAHAVEDPVTTYHRIQYRIHDQPLVSILLPTAGRIVKTDNGREVNVLLQCLKSVEEKTSYPHYEIVLAYNGNLTPETKRFIEQHAKKSGRYTVLDYRFHGPFNFADKLNFIARHARGDYFVFLNDDVEVISPNWLTVMLEFAQQPRIGVVGAKLYFPNGAIQHAGAIMGIGGGVSHAFLKLAHDDPGYFAMTKVIRNYSVVTGACCMTKADLFRKLGGLDRKFGIDYNDVDYCLRAGKLGYRVVFTPYAELIHYESASLGSRAGQVDQEEEKLLRKRWADVIANDPLYNPNLTLQDTNFQIRL